ncbi:MAG: collagen-like protein, partial [Wolbachia endosymbiont of Homalodisca vitripennis]|nr:collagen-like protein [Wolbachia endosymbiont of Homalodisca vitripennis]
MRFNLEPGSAFCNGKNKLVTFKINDEESISLPYKSYVFDSDNNFIISNFMMKPTNSILTNLSRGLNLKREKVGDDYKLVLVDDSDQYYYTYYYSSLNFTIATFDSIPTNLVRDDQDRKYIYSYKKEECLLDFIPLINNKILIDLEDIMSNQEIDFILTKLANSPSKKLRIGVGKNFLRGSEGFVPITYRAAEVYGTINDKIGVLNNIAVSFRDSKLKLYSGNTAIDEMYWSSFGGYLNTGNTFLRIKKSNNNMYIGCIADEYIRCHQFYGLPPQGSERGNMDYDNKKSSSSYNLYPYYYNLHNLRMSMNHKKIEELERQVQDLKEKFQSLQGDIRNVAIPGAPGLDGRPRDKGEQGIPGKNGADASPQEVAQKLIDSDTMIDKLLTYRSKESNSTLVEEMTNVLISNEEIHIQIADALSTELVNKVTTKNRIIKAISEELRKNPGEVQGPKGDKGAPGIDGLPGVKGKSGKDGSRGWKG